MRVSRIYRLLRLVAMLQSGRSYSAEQLAQELEVSRRTVFRDLNVLEMAHIPYYFDQDAGGYKISEHFFLPPVNLTLPEALCLLVLTGRLRGAKKVPLLSAGRQAAMKIESVLPGSVREHVGGLLESMTVRLGPFSRHEGLDELFDRLSVAIAERRPCRIVYISFLDRGQISQDIRPLRLVFVGRAWYLIAHVEQHGELRTFKLGRIRKLDELDGTFEPPPGDPMEHFGRAWSMIPEGRVYDVHLHFEPKVAGNVAEVGWHPSQRVEWNADGSIEFRAQIDGIGEILWWILGYGDQVEVVAPPELRRRVADMAKAVSERYERDADVCGS